MHKIILMFFVQIQPSTDRSTERQEKKPRRKQQTNKRAIVNNSTGNKNSLNFRWKFFVAKKKHTEH